MLVVLLLTLANRAEAQTSACSGTSGWDTGGWAGSWSGGYSAQGSIRSLRPYDTIVDSTGTPWAHPVWVTEPIMQPSDGTAIRYFAIILDANPNPYERYGSFCIRDYDGWSYPYYFWQLPKPQCTYRVTPSATSFSASGGSASIAIEAFPNVPTLSKSDCGWGAGTGDPRATWFSGYTPQTGAGDATLTFDIQPLTVASSRSVTTHVAGEIVALSQFGTGCSVVASTRAVSLNNSGQGTFTFTIRNTSPDECQYSVIGGVYPKVVLPEDGNGELFGYANRTVAANSEKQEVVRVIGGINPFCSRMTNFVNIKVTTRGGGASERVWLLWPPSPQPCQPDRKIGPRRPDDYKNKGACMCVRG